jgi:hypothetical protein
MYEHWVLATATIDWCERIAIAIVSAIEAIV